MEEPYDALVKRQEEMKEWLMSLEGVQGTGVGLDQNNALALKVYVSRVPDAVLQRIHSRLADVPHVVEEHGTFRFL